MSIFERQNDAPLKKHMYSAGVVLHSYLLITATSLQSVLSHVSKMAIVDRVIGYDKLVFNTYHKLYNIWLFMFIRCFEIEQLCHHNHMIHDCSSKWSRNMFILRYTNV